MGTIQLTHLDMGDINTVTQVWDFPRLYLGTGVWPGIGSVWPQCQNTLFRDHLSIFIASISRCVPFKSQSRCSGVATKICGIDVQTPTYSHVRVPRGTKG